MTGVAIPLGVPFTGAWDNVDLGSQNLTTTGLGTFGNLNVDDINLNDKIITFDNGPSIDGGESSLVFAATDGIMTFATGEMILTATTADISLIHESVGGVIQIGSSTGATLRGASGVLTLAGIGNTNNENLLFDFEGTENTVGISSGSGVLTINWGSLNLTTTGYISVGKITGTDPVWIGDSADGNFRLPTPVAISGEYVDLSSSGTCRYVVQGTTPLFHFLKTDGATDEKFVTMGIIADVFELRIANDNNTLKHIVMSVDLTQANVTFAGTLASGTHTISTLVLAAASITDTSGAINFGDENLTTTGTLAAGATTLSGDTTVAGNLTVDTSTLFVDSASNEVGIGTASPSHRLHVLSDSGGAVSEVAFFRGGGSQDDESEILVGTSTSNFNSTILGHHFKSGVNTDYGYVRLTGGAKALAWDKDGKAGIGTTSPSAQLHVDQSSTTAAIPAIFLDQADVSEEMIEFNTTIGTGNAIEAIGAKSLTTTHFIKITLPGGLTRYIPAGTIA